ncbi:hypothetical protein ACFVHW_14905 [Streptomyces sp. NPDC127110]|uniref:hypothetical protein n=1 Tax=Streptomyces sp. NPDC127110 TaxID=3345362 RepID=UPI00362E82E0
MGPLRFGMNPDEVSAVLADMTAEAQQFVITHCRDGRQVREVGRCWKSGLFLFYSRDERLQGLAVDGLRGPQVLAEGVPLTGRVPSEVERWMTARAAERFPEDDFEFGYLGTGIPCSWSLGLVVSVQRMADHLVTRPVIFAEHVLDDPRHTLPQEAWTIY